MGNYQVLTASFHTYPHGWPYRVSSWKKHLKHTNEHTIVWSKALIKGMRRSGVNAYIGPRTEPTDADIAVFWSWKREKIIEKFQSSGRHILVMERGFIHPRTERVSLAVDGFNGRENFLPTPDGSERWERLFSHHLKP